MIAEKDRKCHWPLGCRPDDYPSLSELGLQEKVDKALRNVPEDLPHKPQQG